MVSARHPRLVAQADTYVPGKCETPRTGDCLLWTGNEDAWLGHFLRTWSREGFPEEAFAEYVRCYAIEHTPATGAAYYRCYKADTARWAEIAGTRFAMPGLYIYGRHDPVIIPAFTQHLDDVFDDIRLEELDAAHFVQEERPREVAALIRDFLSPVATG